uniref:Uncharacterized protein n=1 Tax=Romanomermis culicivorax TaxID=13658 RepID=A0A915JSZ4_ROMCU
MLIKFIFVLWLFAIPFHEGISSNIRIIEDCNYDGNDISNVHTFHLGSNFLLAETRMFFEVCVEKR